MKVYFYFLFFLLFGCNSNNIEIANHTNSFYFWKTTFDLNDYENNFLEQNNINKLYIRFFDVAVVNENIEPIGKIIFNKIPKQNIVPVVFIKNDVFNKSNLNIDSLAIKVNGLIHQIAAYNKLDYSEIQIDCDWSKGTKTAYFTFLDKLKQLDNKLISVTIRLHQIKYPDQTGIPNVNYGVLMYYNMGKINADEKNSIYDREIALKYIPSVSNYKLPLVTALPIFNWLIHSRNGHVQSIIPKVNLKNIDNLKEIKPNIYEVQNVTYYQNYILKKGDILKYEHVSVSDIKNIISDINRYSNSATNSLIWYDLDEHNLKLYENEKLFD